MTYEYDYSDQVTWMNTEWV